MEKTVVRGNQLEPLNLLLRLLIKHIRFTELLENEKIKSAYIYASYLLIFSHNTTRTKSWARLVNDKIWPTRISDSSDFYSVGLSRLLTRAIKTDTKTTHKYFLLNFGMKTTVCL